MCRKTNTVRSGVPCIFFIAACLTACFPSNKQKAPIAEKIDEAEVLPAGVVAPEELPVREEIQNRSLTPVSVENEVTIEAYRALIHTDQGTLCCDLFKNDAPKSVQNFVDLVQNKVTFDEIPEESVYTDMVLKRDPHKVFVETAFAEGKERKINFFVDDEISSLHKHQRGTLSYVQRQPRGNAVHFFITLKEYPLFDDIYTIFGQCYPNRVLELFEKDEKRFKITSIDIESNFICDREQ